MRRVPTLVWEAAALLAAAALCAWVFAWLPARDAAAPAATPAKAAGRAASFAPSLAGTHADGGATSGADGLLVANEDLVELFDYYLATVGEKTPAQVRAEIERELERRLRPPASNAARQLLGRYLGYKAALVELERRKDLAGAGAAAIRKRLQAMRTLRGRYFSAQESRAMFGREDAEQQDMLARVEVRQDRGLNADQQRERLAELDAALPPEVREARAAPVRIARLEESVGQMRARGAGDEEVFRARAEALDPDAARRLAEVDREEAEWRRRIAAYLDARRSLRDARALAGLRERMFTAEERRRLPAYEGSLQ